MNKTAISEQARDDDDGNMIGKSIPRLEGEEKCSGRAVYTDDMTLPGMLHGALLASPYPHARILSYDISNAKALPGVKAVLTGEDFGQHFTGPVLKDQTPLAVGKVRYVGEPVCAVAAVDIKTAREALLLIEVEYEELQAVFDPEEALQADAPVLHEQRDAYPCIYEKPKEANGIYELEFQRGDTAAAWDTCDVILEDEYYVPAQHHMYMEPVTTLAECDARGKVTIWSAVQGVARTQVATAESLGLPMSKVRIIAPHIGGGFGGKGETTNQPITAALSIATSKPVKMTLSREEDMMMMKSRHAGKIKIKTGASKDGKLIAREVDIILNGGAYADASPEVAATAAFFGAGPYQVPNISIRSRVAYTNRLRAGAFRGFGNPQATFASESQIDDLADKLNIDPIDIRLMNALESGDSWLGGKSIETGSLKACLELVREKSAWDSKYKKSTDETGSAKKRGIGVSGIAHICGMLSSGANVALNDDGTFTVNTGAVDIGQGCDTLLSQIAAATFNVDVDQINYAQPDSDHSPYNFQTAASRTTYMVGGAVKKASEFVRDQIFEVASEMFECAVCDLELRPGGKVGVKGVGDVELHFAQIAGRSMYAAGGVGPIAASYNWYFDAPKGTDPKRDLVKGFDLSDMLGVFTFGAHVYEVEIDVDTGAVEVMEVWAAHDVGRAINPKAVEGQIQGGIAQGLGYTLLEELLWDNGVLINPSMMDYKLPGAADLPYAVHPLIIEMPDKSAPFGAKGVAEICCIGVAPGVRNAIKNAAETNIYEIPVTPERMLTAMGDTF